MAVRFSKKKMRITVNQQPFDATGDLTHHQVARLVDPAYDNRQRVRIRFAGAGDGTASGVLRAGEEIRVVEGMRFEVVATPTDAKDSESPRR